MRGDGSVSKKDYAIWPLFNEFREQEIFRTTYLEVFGEEFTAASESKKSEAASESVPADQTLGLEGAPVAPEPSIQ